MRRYINSLHGNYESFEDSEEIRTLHSSSFSVEEESFSSIDQFLGEYVDATDD